MKTKPFNLEEALNGAKVVTRDGREVKELTKFESFEEYPLVGVLGGKLTTWTKQGEYYKSKEESHADLFLAVEPQRIWVNVFYNNNLLWVGNICYESKKRAEENAISISNIKYIKTIEITDEL